MVPMNWMQLCTIKGMIAFVINNSACICMYVRDSCNEVMKSS